MKSSYFYTLFTGMNTAKMQPSHFYALCTGINIFLGIFWLLDQKSNGMTAFFFATASMTCLRSIACTIKENSSSKLNESDLKLIALAIEET